MSLPAESSGAVGVTVAQSPVAQPSTITVDSQIFVPETSVRKSILVGSALCLLGCVGFAISALDLNPSRQQQLTGVFAFLAGVALALEIADLLKNSQKRYSPLNFVPSCGAFLICAAGLLAALVPAARDDSFAATLLGGPALTAGLVLLVRGCITRLWAEADSLSSLVPGYPRDVKAIADGEMFTITPGVVVPTDGRVRSGTCAVLERYLSPDTHFRVKDETDVVFAGSYVLSGEASVQALTSSYDSCLKRMEQAVLPGLRWVEDSLKRDHDHIVTPLVYVLLFCFVSSGIFWDERGAAGSTILLASGSILLISLLAQLGEALYAKRSRIVRSWAQRGFLINSAKAWTEMYNVRSLVVDPSRLAPSTACHVRELNLLDDRLSEQSLCACIGSIVGRAEDPALLTIGDFCQRVGGALETDRVVDLREYEGRGICGTVKGIEFSIGSEDFLLDRGIQMQPTDTLIEESDTDRIVLVAIGDDVLARFWVSFGQQDAVSEESQHRWPKNLHGRVADVGEREFPADTLLVRGDESDVVGRAHSPELRLLIPNTLEVPSSSLVALTSRLELLPLLVKDCRRHVHEVLRARAWILFATFVGICLVFAGFVTPVLPLALVPIVALCILL
jgi:cation transport ATPase